MSETPPDRSTIDDLRDRFRARLESSETVAALKSLHDQFLSRKSGTITGLMKTLGSLPQDARREFGSLVNTLKTEIENAIEEKRQTLESSRPPAGAVDITLPGRPTPIGHVHPLMRVRQQVEDIFSHMGYEILEGPEVEDDFHNFEALNMPPEHPARDMQDTLYLAQPIVGGTWGAHRSPVPGHVPEAQVRAATGRAELGNGRGLRTWLSPSSRGCICSRAPIWRAPSASASARRSGAPTSAMSCSTIARSAASTR